MAEIDARRQAILEKARAAMRAEYRQSQGLPSPAPEVPGAAPQVTPASAPATPALASTPAPAPAPQASPGAIAEAITAGLQQQMRDAEAMRTEANCKLAEADAKIAAWQQNPATYLADQGLSIDQWQARLLNGGEPTAEEKLKAELVARVDPAIAELRQEVQQLRADAYGNQRQRVLQEIAPVLARDFPIVNKLLGPEQVIAHLEQLRDRTKASVDPQATLAALESRFLQQYQESLQDPAVASKVMPSVNKSPRAEVVASTQSPQTLTNRVTSTVPPSSSRPMTERERFARGREEIRKLLAAGRL